MLNIQKPNYNINVPVGFLVRSHSGNCMKFFISLRKFKYLLGCFYDDVAISELSEATGYKNIILETRITGTCCFGKSFVRELIKYWC